jgi:uncharacterized protein (DUF58 family)
VVLEDPREQELPAMGLVAVEDPETGESLVVDTGDARVREEFRRQRNAARAERDRMLRSLDIDAVNVSTGESYTGALLRFFRAREKRQ